MQQYPARFVRLRGAHRLVNSAFAAFRFPCRIARYGQTSNILRMS
jgi:hypothetical protein